MDPPYGLLCPAVECGTVLWLLYLLYIYGGCIGSMLPVYSRPVVCFYYGVGVLPGNYCLGG